MNLTRIVVLCVALVAAGAAVLVMRGMLGGGTPTVQASVPPPTTADVLVASKDIASGRVLAIDSVRWQSWPQSSVSDAFIVRTPESKVEKVVEGVVVRAPLVAGQPITEASIVHSGSAGFMAATLSPGMRAVSIAISEETGAGGFILPNDRVDVIQTRDLSQGGGTKNFQAQTILRDVRVLAIGQAADQPKDAQVVTGKTATVELTPYQSELIQQARLQGTLSLALRPLGDSDGSVETAFGRRDAGVNVIRYGVARNAAGGEGKVQ
jgi:pilus assembly protein CpaB